MHGVVSIPRNGGARPEGNGLRRRVGAGAMEDNETGLVGTDKKGTTGGPVVP